MCIGDLKLGQDTNADGKADYYTTAVQSLTDYGPFGEILPGRAAVDANGYRYGFNGQEKSEELGAGHTTALFWEYDARIGRRWNLDPVPVPWESQYAANRNNPILYNDPNGDTPGSGDDPLDGARIGMMLGGLCKLTARAVMNLTYQAGDALGITPAGKGMKWEAVEEFSNGKYETVMRQVPRAGVLRDVGGHLLDGLSAGSPISPGKNASAVLFAKTVPKPLMTNAVVQVAKGGFNASSFADEIIALNKATDGGGVLLNGTPSSAINSAMYYETAAEQGAAIFRSISGGHMFLNGNKRTAVAAFQSFAEQHGLQTVSQSQMMNVATEVATGLVTDISQISKMLIK